MKCYIHKLDFTLTLSVSWILISGPPVDSQCQTSQCQHVVGSGLGLEGEEPQKQLASTENTSRKPLAHEWDSVLWLGSIYWWVYWLTEHNVMAVFLFMPLLLGV